MGMYTRKRGGGKGKKSTVKKPVRAKSTIKKRKSFKRKSLYKRRSINMSKRSNRNKKIRGGQPPGNRTARPRRRTGRRQSTRRWILGKLNGMRLPDS